MAALITQDFEFTRNSLLYGQFLVECHESYPDVVITDTVRWHAYNTNTLYVTVDVPEDLAVVLKLRFGNQFRIRVGKEYTEDIIFDSSFSRWDEEIIQTQKELMEKNQNDKLSEYIKEMINKHG